MNRRQLLAAALAAPVAAKLPAPKMTEREMLLFLKAALAEADAAIHRAMLRCLSAPALRLAGVEEDVEWDMAVIRYTGPPMLTHGRRLALGRADEDFDVWTEKPPLTIKQR